MKKRINTLLTSLLMAASITAHAAPKAEVLVLLSSETALPLKGGETYSTGFYLNELGVPVAALQDAGYAVTIVTPKGNQPAVDKTSVDPVYFGGDAKQMQHIESVVAGVMADKKVASLEEVLKAGPDHYAGLFIPGGHAPLIDLANDPNVGKLLRHFHSAAKPTAAICHGPIALLSAQDNPAGFEQKTIAGQPGGAKNWIYAGYKMTIFSNAEEKVFEASLKGKMLRYYPAQAMTQAGGEMHFAPAWKPNVVIDRELITGQNPFSDRELAKAFIAALDKRAGQP